MHECLGKHSCMSSPFLTAILNGISLFLTLVQEKLNMPSGHYYRHCSWSGRSNHLIKVNTSHCLCEVPRLLIIFIIFAVRYPFSRAIICGIIIIRSEWFFDCSSPFCFLLIEFQCTFFISYKKYHIMFIIRFIIRWWWASVGFFSCRFTSFHARASLLAFFISFFVLFSVSLSYFILAVLMCESLGKHSCRSSQVSYSHTEWYLLFFSLWKQWIIGIWALLNKFY